MGDNYLVVGLNKRTDADMKEFEQKKDDLLQRELTNRRSQVFDDYITTVQNKMKADGSVKINQPVLDQVIAEAPAPAPRQMPRNLPFPTK